jgi:hypothetical protein
MICSATYILNCTSCMSLTYIQQELEGIAVKINLVEFSKDWFY